MAGDVVHDLFTVFISKTPPTNEFVYAIEIFLGHLIAKRCLDFAPHDKSLFRQRPQNQVPQPIWVRYTFTISPERFHGRVHAEIAVRTIGVLPALVPVNRSLDAGIPCAKHRKSAPDPFGLANPTALSGVRKFASRPFGN